MYNVLKITIVTVLAILISNIFTIEFANSQPMSMEGTSSNDKIIGREGNDNIEGIEGNDVLDGWFGDDKIDGGKGADLLEGSEGGDSFICDSKDVIIDFNHQEGDSIDGACRYDYIPKQL